MDGAVIVGEVGFASGASDDTKTCGAGRLAAGVRERLPEHALKISAAARKKMSKGEFFNRTSQPAPFYQKN